MYAQYTENGCSQTTFALQYFMGYMQHYVLILYNNLDRIQMIIKIILNFNGLHHFQNPIYYRTRVEN